MAKAAMIIRRGLKRLVFKKKLKKLRVDMIKKKAEEAMKVGFVKRLSARFAVADVIRERLLESSGSSGSDTPNENNKSKEVTSPEPNTQKPQINSYI